MVREESVVILVIDSIPPRLCLFLKRTLISVHRSLGNTRRTGLYWCCLYCRHFKV